MKTLNYLALILTIVGALNWGLWGFFQFDLVAWLAHGNTNGLARFIYSLVGLAGVWNLRLLSKCCSSRYDQNDRGSGCCK